MGARGTQAYPPRRASHHEGSSIEEGRPRMSRRLATIFGGLALSLVAATAPVTAASNTMTMPLHGTKCAGKAMASAKITMVGKDSFRGQLTCEHLPAPTSLHAKPPRSA